MKRNNDRYEKDTKECLNLKQNFNLQWEWRGMSGEEGGWSKKSDKGASNPRQKCLGFQKT